MRTQDQALGNNVPLIFREETGNEKSLSHIRVASIVNSLLLNSDKLLSTILEDCHLDMTNNQEFAITVLEKMFALFLTVRSSSFVKYFPVKKGKKKTTSKKEKALRRELKRNKEGNWYRIKCNYDPRGGGGGLPNICGWGIPFKVPTWLRGIYFYTLILGIVWAVNFHGVTFFHFGVFLLPS